MISNQYCTWTSNTLPLKPHTVSNHTVACLPNKTFVYTFEMEKFSKFVCLVICLTPHTHTHVVSTVSLIHTHTSISHKNVLVSQSLSMQDFSADFDFGNSNLLFIHFVMRIFVDCKAREWKEEGGREASEDILVMKAKGANGFCLMSLISMYCA